MQTSKKYLKSDLAKNYERFTNSEWKSILKQEAAIADSYDPNDRAVLLILKEDSSRDNRR